MDGINSARDAVRRRKRWRWDFLHDLYRNNLALERGIIQDVPAVEVAKAVGIENGREAEVIWSYLQDAELIQLTGFGPQVGITRHGIDAVEDALAEPESSTQHFPPVNQIHVWGGIHASQIVQGSAGATVSVALTQSNAETIHALMLELRSAASGLVGSPKATVDAELATVEAQLASPAPRRTVVIECLTSVRSVLEQTGAALAAQKIATVLQQMGWL